MVDEVRIYAPSTNYALRQGEILSALIEPRVGTLSQDTRVPPELQLIQHPYAIVLSQDCDLEQDFIARTDRGRVSNAEEKLLPSVLLCEVEPAVELKTRLADSQIWKRITQNKNERYQYLRSAAVQDDAAGQGFPDLGIDFKRHFTLPSALLYAHLTNQARRRSRLLSPYLEQLSSRFGYFLGRVALPVEHFVKS